MGLSVYALLLVSNELIDWLICTKMRKPFLLRNHKHFKKLSRFRRVVQKLTIFRRAEGINEIFCVFCYVLDLHIGYIWRAPEARAKILWYFVGRQYMTSFFQIPEGGGKCTPCPPLRQWPKVTSKHVQLGPTRPNEICFMHNFHAILNDCKVMYFKYITSYAYNRFVFALISRF